MGNAQVLGKEMLYIWFTEIAMNIKVNVLLIFLIVFLSQVYDEQEP